MPATSSKIAPVDFTGVEPISMENFAWLSEGWYKLRIDDTKYTPESITDEGKAINPNISWILTVSEALDASSGDCAGKRIRDTFWYNSKRNFGVGRFMQALEALRNKRPVGKDGADYKGNMDLSAYDGMEVLGYVADNDYNGRTTTQVQRYRNIADEAKVRAEIASGPQPVGKRAVAAAAAVATPEESADDPFS